MVDGVGDELFPGAALAAYQHRGIPAGNLTNNIHNLPHRRAFTDHIFQAETARRGTGARALYSGALLRRLRGGGWQDHQANRLGDQIGDGFEKARAGGQPLFLTRHRLRRQYADGPGVGAHQRNGDKRQVIVVQAQTIEKTLVVGDARQHQRLALRQHGTD